MTSKNSSRLGERLQELLRAQVVRYVDAPDVEAEFHSEWSRMGEHLQRHGGLEQAVRDVYADGSPQPDSPTRVT